MNYHISKEFQDVCYLCIENCKTCIDRLREMLIECELDDVAVKCAKEINSSIFKCTDVLDYCQRCMNFAQEHLENCDDPECKEICLEIIDACRECIKSCNDIDIECNHKLDECLKAAKECMIKCKNCIKVLEKGIKILKSKV